jgi:hypothetical protein
VIPRDDVNRNASVSDARQRSERLIRQAWKDARAVEDIATVHHKIDRAVERRLQRSSIVGEKVVSATATFDSWAHRKVEAEVRVCEEEDADYQFFGISDTG